MTTMYGPRPGEGPAPRVGPVGRVAVLSDVHANVPALTAVLAEVERVGADLVVFCGDLTWGPEPDRTVELVTALGDRARFVRGNGERAVVDMARGERVAERERERWMVARHSRTGPCSGRTCSCGRPVTTWRRRSRLGSGWATRPPTGSPSCSPRRRPPLK